jgi:uncharacterized protein YcbX
VTGTVAALYRYPVKSMLGEPLRTVTIDAYGLHGDRTYAVVDAVTGAVASAKRPHLWKGLLTVRAHRRGAMVVLVLPGGREVTAGTPDADAALSALLGRPVRLTADAPAGARVERAVPEEVLSAGPDADVPVTVGGLAGAAPAGTFFDYAPVHLLTTATLAAVAAHAGRGRADAVRYRPGLVLDLPAARGFAENEWPGRLLRVGEAVLRPTIPTPRCAVPTLAHGDLPAAPDALRVPARHNRVPVPGMAAPAPVAGVYADVVTPGRVEVGGPVTLTPAGR